MGAAGDAGTGEGGSKELLGTSLKVKNSRLILLAFILTICQPARSEPPPFLGCQSNGCIGVFGSLYVDSSGSVFIMKPGATNTSPLQCSLESGNYFTLKRSHIAFKEIYALLLSASAGQKLIYIRAVDNSPGCEVLYAVEYP